MASRYRWAARVSSPRSLFTLARLPSALPRVRWSPTAAARRCASPSQRAALSSSPALYQPAPMAPVAAEMPAESCPARACRRLSAPELERGGHALLTNRRAAGAPQAVRRGDVHSVGASRRARSAPLVARGTGRSTRRRTRGRGRARSTRTARARCRYRRRTRSAVRGRPRRGDCPPALRPRRDRKLPARALAARGQLRAVPDAQPLPPREARRRTAPASTCALLGRRGPGGLDVPVLRPEAESGQGEVQRSRSAAHRIVCPHSALES